jgi:hypothetical protein
MKAAKLTATLACACAFLATAGAVPAMADFSFSSFSAGFETPGGEPMNVAGGRADVTTKFTINTDPANPTLPEEAIKDVITDLPAGFYGNPTIVPTCDPRELLEREGFCAIASQVGVLAVAGTAAPSWPLYVLPATTEQTAVLGAEVLGALVKVVISSRTDGDYGLTARITNTNQAVAVYDVRLTLWGVPADPAHDPERWAGFINGGASAGFSPRPFISLPTRCEPMRIEVRANSWQHPDQWITGSQVTPPLTGCDSLRFEPDLQVRPGSAEAAAPTGLAIDLTIPQNESVQGQATPQMRRAVVTLPKGYAISPGSAAGLGACSDSQIALGTKVEPSCPNSSVLGTAVVETPVLEEPLTGDVYLGQPEPGNLFRLYMVLHGPGLLIKIPGVAKPDSATGQITTTFNETPQLPYEHLRMEFKAGPRAPISTPTACGTYTTHAELTSWASPVPVSSDSSFTINQNCGNDGKFSPSLEAGTTNPTAGAYSPFVLRVIGQNGQQNLAGIEAKLPQGLLAKLAGVPTCAGSAAASGACPAASQVGKATVGSGLGASPIYVPEAGKEPTAVYLGGPYKGAPYSLIVKVPAQAGPFNLGTVVVRNGIYIDPVTTQVTTKSDSLPQILEGVPISYRDLRIEIDRPSFTVNPTNCEATKVASTLASASGTSATPSDRFQAASCASLDLKPKLAFKFSGAPTRRGGHPKLTATLTTGKNEANLQRVQVTLPKTEFLENAHIRTVCTRVQYAASKCPAKSIYGYAKAWTPLLDKPLEGPVYLRSSNHKLPDLVASLDGQIHVDLDGRIDSVNARIRNTFETVPDAPVSKFVLTMQGGGKGLLANNTNLCKAKPRAHVEFDGQNGKVHETDPLVTVAGCKRGHGKGKQR